MLCIVSSAVSGFAADSVRVRISCTIPAIPGVNAPMVEQETVGQQQTAFVEPKQELDDGLETGQPQEDREDSEGQRQEEEIETTRGTQTVLVKTIYSR